MTLLCLEISLTTENSNAHACQTDEKGKRIVQAAVSFLEIFRPQLPQSRRTLEHTTINSSRNCQRASENGAQAGQETGERLGLLLAVDDLHGGDILKTGVSRGSYFK